LQKCVEMLVFGWTAGPENLSEYPKWVKNIMYIKKQEGGGRFTERETPPTQIEFCCLKFSGRGSMTMKRAKFSNLLEHSRRFWLSLWKNSLENFFGKILWIFFLWKIFLDYQSEWILFFYPPRLWTMKILEILEILKTDTQTILENQNGFYEVMTLSNIHQF
jgi:hypothetical protein